MNHYLASQWQQWLDRRVDALEASEPARRLDSQDEASDKVNVDVSAHPPLPIYVIGHWRVTSLADGCLGASFYCPSCNAMNATNDRHDATPDGMVYPPVRCSNLGWNWCGVVRLAGWAERMGSIDV